jgi:adhesin transport system membrane fusion protein
MKNYEKYWADVKAILEKLKSKYWADIKAKLEKLKSLRNQLLNYANQSTAGHGPETSALSRISLIRWSAIIFIVLLLWAAFSKIDQTTRAFGQVITSAKSQVIQSFDGGVLEELLVKEGDTVEKDQILARLDRTRMLTTYLETKAKAAALSTAVSRLRTEVYGQPLKFDVITNDHPEFQANQKILLKKRQQALNEELESIKEQLNLAVAELNMTEPLLKTGDVSKVEVLRLQRQANDLRAQISNKRNKYFQDTQAELNKLEEDLAGVSQVLTQKKEQLDRIELRAPMAGVVKNVKITTLGGVIKPGEEVMQIVPSGDDLVIEAKIKPSDIAFLKPGLEAIIKLDAYDYSIYGTLKGQLTYISADTLTEDSKSGEQTYYRAKIQTNVKQFSSKPKEKLEIQPGMTATIEIITGEHTVLSYLTKPITKTLKESMTER